MRRARSGAARRWPALLVAIIAIVAALLAGCGGSGGSAGQAPAQGVASVTAADGAADGPQTHPDVPGVPDAAWRTLTLIDSGDWPEAADAPGTRGGGGFGNREGHLPARDGYGGRIRYREWDVNPKEPHRGRDAERIVTGNDGSAWYTGDHYSTFTRMR